jgi:hypothetical protein
MEENKTKSTESDDREQTSNIKVFTVKGNENKVEAESGSIKGVKGELKDGGLKESGKGLKGMKIEVGLIDGIPNTIQIKGNLDVAGVDNTEKK